MPEIMARGPNFVYAKEFILEKHGEALWENILRALPQKALEVWTLPHLMTEEYSFAAFKALVRVVSDMLHAGADEQMAEMYAYIADRSLNSVYKVFFRLSQPASVIKNYPKLWARFFSVGTVTVVVAEKKHAVLEFTVPEIFLDWLPGACAGFSQKAIELAGGRELQIRETSRFAMPGKAWKIMYELQWQE